ncbi:MAG: hypothetical protein U5K27_21435 [Desulfotignum sp.]|nr:hypothetical protein [Desulfotignum sp.]
MKSCYIEYRAKWFDFSGILSQWEHSTEEVNVIKQHQQKNEEQIMKRVEGKVAVVTGGALEDLVGQLVC